MNNEQLDIASQALVNFCKEDITKEEARLTIMIVLRVLERLSEIGIE